MSRRFPRGPAAGQEGSARLPFGQFREGLYRYLLRKLRQAENAEDLTQEVYLRLLRTPDRKLVRNPQAYVFGVAFNVLYEFKLDEQHNPVAFDSPAVERLEDVLPDPADAPDKAQERRGREQWLDDVMARLSRCSRRCS